jgi:hypothetical protein
MIQQNYTGYDFKNRKEEDLLKVKMFAKFIINYEIIIHPNFSDKS